VRAHIVLSPTQITWWDEGDRFLFFFQLAIFHLHW
jgi:hypothetical protein